MLKKNWTQAEKMLRSYNQRAEREVSWRTKHRVAIITVARFLGSNPLVVGAEMSKRIDGGRVRVFEGGHHVGYA